MLITSELREDGFGSQFQTLICSIIYIENTGNTFVYTDINSIEHTTNTKNNSYNDIIEYMNIKKNYINLSQIDNKEDVQICTIHNAYNTIESNIEYYYNTPAFNKLKQFFYKDKFNKFDNNYINVCVHIRKFNSSDPVDCLYENGQPSWRFINNSYFLDRIKNIREKYYYKNLKFHIYSQGNIDDFKEFIANDTILHLNTSIIDTFNDLVFADILVTSPSALSYVAALLSEGEIHYKAYHHRPRQHWHIYYS